MQYCGIHLALISSSSVEIKSIKVVKKVVTRKTVEIKTVSSAIFEKRQTIILALISRVSLIKQNKLREWK